MAFTDFIAPIAGAATGLIGNAANVYMQNRQNEENQRLAEQNNQWNIDQWNRANEYNTPANQMKRLRDAGLNTSLMYGSPTNVAISSPQADTSNKGQSPKVDFNSIVSNAQQMMLQQQLTRHRLTILTLILLLSLLIIQLKMKMCLLLKITLYLVKIYYINRVRIWLWKVVS